MNRFRWIAVALPLFATLLLAQPAPEPDRPGLRELEYSIQAELQNHGERVMGKEMLRWSTRLERISNCRAEFTVRVTSNYGEPTVHSEKVSFSLGAIGRFEIAEDKNWLQLPCAGNEKCVSSFSACSKRTKEGIVVDCSASSQKRQEVFTLQFDGDAAASARLKQYFSRAIEVCHEGAPSGF